MTEQATRAEDARLAYGKDPLQFALGWKPADEPRGLIVLVHGGCWLNQFDLTHTEALAAALAAEGYSTWSLEYRRTGDPGGGWPGSLRDVEAGALSVLQNQPKLPAVLLGHSAGGHLALLAAEVLGDKLQGVVGLAAITDIETYARGTNSCQQAARLFMGGLPEEIPEAYAAATVTDMPIRARLLHGSADSIVPVDQADVGQTPAKVLPGAGHYDWIHPGTTAFGTLLETLEDMFKP